jgi:hypothetical protein
MIVSGLHEINDLDVDPAKTSQAVAKHWASEFGADVQRADAVDARRTFGGNALLRVRATVAHDSYERLVRVRCSHEDHRALASRSALGALPKIIEDPSSVGIVPEKLISAAQEDDGIAEFCRFYLERRGQELRSAGMDERKRKKLEDDFTPRLQISLVGLEGKVHRDVNVNVGYSFAGEGEYESTLSVAPHDQRVVDAPKMRVCAKSGRMVPTTCLGRCEITGA